MKLTIEIPDMCVTEHYYPLIVKQLLKWLQSEVSNSTCELNELGEKMKISLVKNET